MVGVSDSDFDHGAHSFRKKRADFIELLLQSQPIITVLLIQVRFALKCRENLFPEQAGRSSLFFGKTS